MISNCLIEAVKAKLKNPKSVKIIKLEKYLNYNTKFHHYFWYNAAEDKVYHFAHVDKNDNKNFLYNGKIKSVSKLSFDKWIDLRIYIYTNSLANSIRKEYDVAEFDKELQWQQYYWLNRDMPDENHWCAKKNPNVFVCDGKSVRMQGIKEPIGPMESWCYISELCPVPYYFPENDNGIELGSGSRTFDRSIVDNTF